MEAKETELMGKLRGFLFCYEAFSLLSKQIVENKGSKEEKNLYNQLPHKLISQYYLLASL